MSRGEFSTELRAVVKKSLGLLDYEYGNSASRIYPMEPDPVQKQKPADRQRLGVSLLISM